MSDIQFFKIVDVLDGTPVSDSTSGADRTVRLRLKGKASLVAEVTVNGYVAKSFLAVGERLLDVVIPVQVANYALTDLSFLVLSSGYTTGQASYEILFDIGRVSTMIRGNDVLIQKWVRFMLMSRGSDKRDTEAGVGLLRLAGQANPSNIQSIRVTVARMHHECKRQIIQRQTREVKRSNRSELLKDATLSGVTLDDDGRLVIESILIDGANRTFAIGTRI